MLIGPIFRIYHISFSFLSLRMILIKLRMNHVRSNVTELQRSRVTEVKGYRVTEVKGYRVTEVKGYRVTEWILDICVSCGDYVKWAHTQSRAISAERL